MIEKELERALQTLKNGGILVYPTDTIWGIGCDAANAQAVRRIYELKNRDDSKSMICLVSDNTMLSRHIDHIPSGLERVLDEAERPTTVIYENPKGVASNIVAPDHTLAIRMVNSGFAHDLLKRFGKPIVSTSANISGEPHPANFSEINPVILKGVDYVVNLQLENQASQPSRIVKLNSDDTLIVIRE